MITTTCSILVKSPGPGGCGAPPTTGRPAEGEQLTAAFEGSALGRPTSTTAASSVAAPSSRPRFRTTDIASPDEAIRLSSWGARLARWPPQVAIRHGRRRWRFDMAAAGGDLIHVRPLLRA